jgi:hypothetical protein
MIPQIRWPGDNGTTGIWLILTSSPSTDKTEAAKGAAAFRAQLWMLPRI